MNKQLLRVLSLLTCFAASAAYAGDWIADGSTGCKAWNAYPQANESITWSGACVDGKASGEGTLKFFQGDKPGSVTTCSYVEGKCVGKGVAVSANGARYEGDFVDGKRQGRGVLVWSDGSRYEGDFLDNQMTGKGVHTWPNGNRYEGDFVDGNKHGKGVFTWPSGDRYNGQFTDNKRTGKGVYVWPNGNRYEGYFLEGKKHGYGEENIKGGRVNRGIWAADKLERPCNSNSACADMEAEYSTPIANCKVNDVDIAKEYRGECRNGLAHGKGRARGRDVYVGEFKDGDAHGQGLYTWGSGDSYDGTWVNGTRTHGKYKSKGGDEYEGDFADRAQHGFGVRKYSCSCSFWSCDTCTERGWWQNNKLVRSCNSKEACEKLNRLEPLIRKAENEFRCEEAKRINQELEAINAGIFYFDSCVSERKFNGLVKSSDPQAMYLAAGRYESDGERARAKTIYRQIVDRFGKNPIAIKATDRLTRLADVEAVESSNRSAAYQVESAHNQSREASYQQCMNNYSACNRSCDELKSSSARSSCRSGCALCSK